MNSILKDIPFIFSLEEGFQGRGGLDSILRNCLSDAELNNKFYGIGVKPEYSFDLGTRQELHEKVGIGERIVTNRILSILGQ